MDRGQGYGSEATCERGEYIAGNLINDPNVTNGMYFPYLMFALSAVYVPEIAMAVTAE